MLVAGGMHMLTKEWLAKLPLAGITLAAPVGGGDVNAAYHLQADSQDYFLLVQAQQPASFYAGEIAGLRAFADAQVLAPRVIDSGQIQGDAYLLLSYLTNGSGNQADLGRLVAKLHSHRGQRFGFTQPYAGTSVSFANDWTDSWAQLFIEQRLDKLAKHIVAKNLWQATDMAAYQAVRSIISRELSEHRSIPVLLHGDLWSGNYLFTADGAPALIDPAALYGDREFDIGITTVFGGFGADFYSAYQEALPLDSGWQRRLHFYRLYYLMVHLDKFGATYYAAVSAEMQTIRNG
jgi:fructosamine-3-kinase